MRSQVVTAGTGRAGTTLIVQLLDAVGQETTIGTGNIWVHEYANAGLENVPSFESGQRFSKSPWAYLFVDELLLRKDIKLDAVIVSVRDIGEAVSSRIILELESLYRNRTHPATSLSTVWRDHGTTAGGVTFSLVPIDQMRVLTGPFYETTEICVRHDIPIVFLEFPRSAQDARYTFEKLSGRFLGHMTYAELEDKFRRIVSPEMIRVEGEITLARVDGTLSGKLPTPAHLDKTALLRRLIDEEKRSDTTNSALNSIQAELITTRAKLDETLEELPVAKTALAKSSTVSGLFLQFGRLIGAVSAG